MLCVLVLLQLPCNVTYKNLYWLERREKFAPDNEENKTRNILTFNSTIDKILTQIWLNVSTELSKVDNQNKVENEKSQGNFWNSFSQVLSNKIKEQDASNNSLNTILAGIINATSCCNNETALSQDISQPKIVQKSSPEKVTQLALPNVTLSAVSIKSTSESTTIHDILDSRGTTTINFNMDPATEKPIKQNKNKVHPTNSHNNLLKSNGQELDTSKATSNKESSTQEKNENIKPSKSSGLRQFCISSIQNLLFIVIISHSYACIFNFIIT